MNSARNIISKCHIKDVVNMNKIEKETVEEIKDTIEMLEKVLINGFLSDEEKETIRKIIAHNAELMNEIETGHAKVTRKITEN